MLSMAMQNQRRSLLRLGALFLVIAVVLGLLTVWPELRRTAGSAALVWWGLRGKD
jgi:hypothetical protein